MPNFISIPKAVDHLRYAQRISIIGCSGGGKSTLARRIEVAHGLPNISIDRDIRWLPGWSVRDRFEQNELFEKYITQEKWILDGTSVSSFETRIPRSDLVFWVRPSRRRALWQLAKRVFSSYGQVRADMAPGCPEQLPDFEFLHYIWTFEQLQTPRILKAIETFGPNVPVCEVRSVAESDELLQHSTK